MAGCWRGSNSPPKAFSQILTNHGDKDMKDDNLRHRLKLASQAKYKLRKRAAKWRERCRFQKCQIEKLLSVIDELKAVLNDGQ
jgi:hypothetical protein